MKKSLLFFALLYVLPLFTFAASGYPYIYDNDGLLTSEKELSEKAQSAYDASGVYFVILTTTGNTEEGLVDSCYEFYSQHFSGYDCALLTIDLSIRNVRLDGYGSLQYSVSDYEWSEIRGQITPYLSNGDYDGACELFLDLAYAKIYEINTRPSDQPAPVYPSLIPVTPVPQSVPETVPAVLLTALFYAAVISAVIVIIMIIIHATSNASAPRAPGAQNYIEKDSFKLTINKDVFVSTRTTRTRRDNDQNRSSGGSHHSGGHISGGGSHSSGSQGRF